MRAFQVIISDYCIAGRTGVFLLVSVGKILGKASQPTPLAIASAPSLATCTGAGISA